MKRQTIKLVSLIILVAVWLVLACEPVSVSVNDTGEVAFTRGEGVFFADIKKESITTVNWNHNQKPLSVLAR